VADYVVTPTTETGVITPAPGVLLVSVPLFISIIGSMGIGVLLGVLFNPILGALGGIVALIIILSRN
jgi:hypothetical protein